MGIIGLGWRGSKQKEKAEFHKKEMRWHFKASGASAAVCGIFWMSAGVNMLTVLLVGLAVGSLLRALYHRYNFKRYRREWLESTDFL